jgi:hypothetical protein
LRRVSELWMCTIGYARMHAARVVGYTVNSGFRESAGLSLESATITRS